MGDILESERQSVRPRRKSHERVGTANHRVPCLIRLSLGEEKLRTMNLGRTLVVIFFLKDHSDWKVFSQGEGAR